MSAYKTDQEFFKESVESILGQRFTRFEFIIVDDGLSEENRSYLASLDDSRLSVLVNERNSGQSVSVNRGIRAARGKYVARMDSDDISLPNRLDIQVAYMDEHPECIACGGFARTTDCGKILPVNYPNLESRRIGFFFSCDMVHPTMMLRRSALEEFGIRYDEKQLYAQDYMIWADLLRHGEIGIVDEVILNYRVHAGQITSSKRASQDEYAIRAQRRYFRNNGFDVDAIDFNFHSMFVKYGVGPSFRGVTKHLACLAIQAKSCLPRNKIRLFQKELHFRALKAGIREIGHHGNLIVGLLLVVIYGVRPFNWGYYVARIMPAKPGQLNE